MERFLEIALSMPTVAFSVMLALVLIYWLFVIIGAVDIDMFGADGVADGLADGIADGIADGMADGMADGIADGMADGLADGLSDGLIDCAVHGVVDGAAHGAAHGLEGVAESLSGIASFINVFNLRKAPVTVVFSLLTLYAWASCCIGMILLGDLPMLPGFAWAIIVSLSAMLLSLIGTAISVKPIAPIFEVHTHNAEATIIGHEVIVRTLSVTADHGQANYDNKGAGLLLMVRCHQDNQLTEGSRALVIDYNKTTSVYTIEPMDAILGKRSRTKPQNETMAQLERELAQVHHKK